MNQQLLIGALIGLVVGAVGGYFFGANQAINAVNEQIAEQGEVRTQAPVNPFEDVTTNPLQDVKTNPYKDVRTNPFE